MASTLVLGLGALALSALAFPVTEARSQSLELPSGLSLANQLEYAWDRDTEEPTLEAWTDVEYASGGFYAGVRFVTFQPPDTTITGSIARSHFRIAHRFVEASSSFGRLRAGHFYSELGQGLALNAYEERDVRVDTNLEGLSLSAERAGLGLKLLSGTTVLGSSEDPDRERTDLLHAADLEYSRDLDPVFATAGASAVRVQQAGASPQNLWSVRGAATRGPVYLYAEHARIDRPGANGYGLYVAATTSIGPLGLTGEVKDYDELELRNSGSIPYNLPPSLIREHTYTLLNRHPHALDADDERGFQVEGTLTLGSHQVVGYYGETRNQDDSDRFNYFDEAYAEVDLSLGQALGLSDLVLVNAFDYQKSFLSPRIEEDEPFRELYSNIHEARAIIDETHSFRIQLEHQHNQSDQEGEFDTYLALLEWSRAPNLTLNLVGETSSRSRTQQELLSGPGGDDSADGIYGVVSLHLSDHHDLSVLVGRRLAGFVCVGGVCREEPEIEGVEVRLLSRF